MALASYLPTSLPTITIRIHAATCECVRTKSLVFLRFFLTPRIICAPLRMLYRRTPPPPSPECVALSARPGGPLRARLPGAFRADLLTSVAPGGLEIALCVPLLSGPPDLGDLVRNSKTQVKSRFQRGRHWPRFEFHLPEIRICRANTLARSGSQAFGSPLHADPVLDGLPPGGGDQLSNSRSPYCTARQDNF